MHISQTASERKSENAGRGRRESLVWRGCLPRYWRPPCAGRGRPFWGKRPPRPLLCGLSGGAGSREKRQALLRKLGLPAHLSPNAMLPVLSALYDRQTLLEEMRKL